MKNILKKLIFLVILVGLAFVVIKVVVPKFKNGGFGSKTDSDKNNTVIPDNEDVYIKTISENDDITKYHLSGDKTKWKNEQGYVVGLHRDVEAISLTESEKQEKLSHLDEIYDLTTQEGLYQAFRTQHDSKLLYTVDESTITFAEFIEAFIITLNEKIAMNDENYIGTNVNGTFGYIKGIGNYFGVSTNNCTNSNVPIISTYGDKYMSVTNAPDDNATLYTARNDVTRYVMPATNVYFRNPKYKYNDGTTDIHYSAYNAEAHSYMTTKLLNDVDYNKYLANDAFFDEDTIYPGESRSQFSKTKRSDKNEYVYKLNLDVIPENQSNAYDFDSMRLETNFKNIWNLTSEEFSIHFRFGEEANNRYCTEIQDKYTKKTKLVLAGFDCTSRTYGIDEPIYIDNFETDVPHTFDETCKIIDRDGYSEGYGRENADSTYFDGLTGESTIIKIPVGKFTQLDKIIGTASTKELQWDEYDMDSVKRTYK